MFRSIQYKLNFYTAMLVLAVCGTTLAFVYQEYPFVLLGIFFIFLCLSSLGKCYKRYNQNMIFLLNALENGDYTFHFSEDRKSTRDKEMVQMMNRIGEILSNARKEVIENENFLSIILESVSTGILIIDDRGIVQRVNQAVLGMFGLPVFTHINHLHNVNESFPALFQELKTGDRTQITLMTEREELQISIRVSQIKLKRGMMRILTLNNINSELESKEMESWIRLIRVMTHEIMNSIAPITSLSETMQFLYQSGDIDSKELRQNTREAFETIHTTATGLLSFVESYRKFTAVPKPKKQKFIINSLVDKVIKLHESALAEKNITLQALLPESFVVYADENLIAQVLINLLKNAIEAIEPESNAKIIISAECNSERIYLNVANTGKPIPADVLPHIFIPFFTTKSSGSGIGLSVSRYIMRLHGGLLHHFVSPDGMTVFQLVMEQPVDE